MKRFGVLISGGGTNLQAVIDAVNDGRISGEICVVIADRNGAYGLTRADNNGIPSFCINKKKFQDSVSFNRAVLDKLREYKAEYIVLAGYLSILSEEIVESYRNRIINIHPSLIPAFCGMGYYGLKVHQAVLDYGAKVTGATVHLVDEGADTGPIILQKPVMVQPGDDAKTLAQRVLKVEHEILPKAVEWLISDRLILEGRKVTLKDEV